MLYYVIHIHTCFKILALFIHKRYFSVAELYFEPVLTCESHAKYLFCTILYMPLKAPKLNICYLVNQDVLFVVITNSNEIRSVPF